MKGLVGVNDGESGESGDCAPEEGGASARFPIGRLQGLGKLMATCCDSGVLMLSLRAVNQ